MGLQFGFDIGVASVGWCVVSADEELKVLESGANIFPCADANNNVERRSARQAKRGIRREKTRISDFQRLWSDFGFDIPDDSCNNQLELRVNGLQEALSINEIYHVLLTMLKHRGISYLEDADDEQTGKGSDYQKGLRANKKKLDAGNFPCHIQLERLVTYGKYRGRINAMVDGDTVVYSNVFTTSGYREEVSAFLDKQQEYHAELSEDFINAYFEVFNRKRKYYEGPGNEASRTDYGKYTTAIDAATGEYITEPNIFNRLIGRCSVRPDEYRAAGASYTAQEFNLLNDLCNLRVNGERLTEEQKRTIVGMVKESGVVKMRSIIEKALGHGEKIKTLEGARIDKNNKEIFHSFEQYRKMKKTLSGIGVDIENWDCKFWDEVGRILTLNTDRESILLGFEEAFGKEGMYFDTDKTRDQEIKWKLIELRKENSALFSKWQSLGLTIMQELIPAMYEQPKNQMQLLTEMGVFKTKVDKFKECVYLPADEVVSDIYNPVVVRAVRITIKILNALIKKYGYPEEIVIEMPRDRNEEEEKKRITDTQKANEKELEDIIKRVWNEYGVKIESKHFKMQNNLAMKLKLWNEQEQKCLYSGREIGIEDLLDHWDKFEIDHIIPRSISFDDSRTNKVLVYATENQRKGNRTPFVYLNSESRDYDYHEFMDMVLRLKGKKKLSEKKANNLLFMEDITKIEVLQGFISRNINDTRYASRVILNAFQDFCRAKGCGTKVKVVRGAFTSQMRKYLRLEKNREESYAHHAVDAMIICFSQLGYRDYKAELAKVVDFENDEIVDKAVWKEKMESDYYENAYEKLMYENRIALIRKLVTEAEGKVKYWHKVDRKPNRKLSDATIYGTRDIEGKKYKINFLNIYDRMGYATFKKMIEKGEQEKFLMYKNDPRTFEDLMKIYRQYQDAPNAFVEYERETGDFARKYSKKHDGPRVEKLKYVDSEVNSCIDISHKYGFEKGSKQVVLTSLNPFCMEVWRNKNTGKYYFVGIKYADLQYDGKINREAHERCLRAEWVLEEGQAYEDLERLGFELVDTFYKNDIIRYEKSGKYYTERFLSRSMPAVRNYIETKPIDRPKFEKQNLVGLSKTTSVEKIRTDILGKQFHV